jgi:hypothetical protein
MQYRVEVCIAKAVHNANILDLYPEPWRFRYEIIFIRRFKTEYSATCCGATADEYTWCCVSGL